MPGMCVNDFALRMFVESASSACQQPPGRVGDDGGVLAWICAAINRGKGRRSTRGCVMDIYSQPSYDIIVYTTQVYRKSFEV